MCWPDAEARNSWGDALLTGVVKEKSWNEAFPAPPPLPWAADPELDSPQLKLSTSISPLCLASALSPSTPSISRNMSTAIAGLLGDEGQRELGRAVTAELMGLLSGDVAAARSHVAAGAAHDGEHVLGVERSPGRARPDDRAVGELERVQLERGRPV